MRVLTFLHSFEPGGVERIALRLVRRWREQGVDAPLFLGRSDGAMADDVGKGLDYIMPRSPFSTAAWETLWMMLTLPRVVRRVRPDVLFCAGNTYTIIAVTLKLRLGRACPPIVAKMSNDLDRKQSNVLLRTGYRWWLRVQGRFIDHVVGMEQPMLDEIVDCMDVSPQAVSIIPDPALSDALIARLRAVPVVAADGRRGRRFVAVGRLVPQKNIGLMLRAFRQGAVPEDRLTLIGDGPERGRLAALAGKLGLADRVDFAGYDPDPAVLLPQFDVLLLSSDYEGVPAVILEALAANLPIVATDCSRSMRALLRDGALGTIVPAGDEAWFATALSAARGGSQNAALSLEQARRFTIEHASDAYLATLAKAAHLDMPGAEQKRVAAEGGEMWSNHEPRAM